MSACGGACRKLLVWTRVVKGAAGTRPVLAAQDGVVPRCDGWSIVPELTLCGGYLPALA
ncbi:hypothetical protein [Streptomyces erythrochromogenes]|uniref:hypothetical protein n=1 Tax=Streptomyces erythrochromogenes TaxID=285574 RepID=UPI00340DC416